MAWPIRAEPEMEGLLCDLLWADPSDDPGVTNIESLSDQVMYFWSTGHSFLLKPFLLY